MVALAGYDNANFKIQNGGKEFIFKTYEYDPETLALVEAENEALLHLKNSNHCTFPEPVPFADGAWIKCLEIGGRKRICRLLTFLDGDLMGNLQADVPMIESLGIMLAHLDLQLQEFDHYTIRARKWGWDIQYLHLNQAYIEDIDDPHKKSIVKYFYQQFEEKVRPTLPELRHSIIHNDVNEWNILIKNGKVSGLFDFGDIAYTPLINELAIAMTYVCYANDDPWDKAAALLRSYHSILPLEEKEIKLLFYLVTARLCISVCNSAHSRKIQEDNEYALVSEKGAWKMLFKCLETNPVDIENKFLQACGLEPEKTASTNEILKQRHQVLSPILSISYKNPIYMNSSAFQYMYDAYGNTFLDAYNNIPHVGHAHPKVVEAGRKQMGILNTNTRYLYDLLNEYAEMLLQRFPPELSKVYFVNSGSAASDLAIRLAQAHTGREHILVMEHGYHGNTQIGIDVSDYKFSNQKGQGQKSHILKAPIPDTYRGKYQLDDGTAGKMYAMDLIEDLQQTELPIAALIAEPIIGCGGQVPLAKGYLKELYPAIRAQGGICISDEVQVGFGRLGDYFWGYEAQEVIPDIVVLGKPIGNGHPMGAVVTTEAVAESFAKGVEFFSSFGGNPVSCAIGKAVLEVIDEEELQENARITGNYYQELFRELQSVYPSIGDVRGSGLFIGVELIKNENKDHNAELAKHIKNELRNRHILISTDGPYDSVLKSKPPLCFNRENVLQVVEQIDDILKQHR